MPYLFVKIDSKCDPSISQILIFIKSGWRDCSPFAISLPVFFDNYYLSLKAVKNAKELQIMSSITPIVNPHPHVIHFS